MDATVNTHRNAIVTVKADQKVHANTKGVEDLKASKDHSERESAAKSSHAHGRIQSHLPRSRVIKKPKMRSPLKEASMRMNSLCDAIFYRNAIIAKKLSQLTLAKSAKKLSKDYNLQMSRVRADHNSLFRALSHQLHGHDKHHTTVRAACALQLELFRGEFDSILFDEIDEHVEKLTSGHPGNNADIQAVGSFYGYKIDVYTVTKCDDSVDVKLTSFPVETGWHVLSSEKHLTVRLSYHIDAHSTVGHYNSLVPTQCVSDTWKGILGPNLVDFERGLSLKSTSKMTHKQFLDKLKQDYQLDVKFVSGDGDCLFRALSQQLYGSEQQHTNVRWACALFVMFNHSHFKGNMTEAELDSHTKLMMQNGTQGT